MIYEGFMADKGLFRVFLTHPRNETSRPSEAAYTQPQPGCDAFKEMIEK